MAQSPQAFLSQYETATATHDLAATLALIAADAVYFFSNESTHVGKAAVARILEHNFDVIAAESFAIENVKWLVETPEAATAVYDYRWSGTIDGQWMSGSGRGTAVLRRDANGWRMVHEHLSRGKFAA